MDIRKQYDLPIFRRDFIQKFFWFDTGLSENRPQCVFGPVSSMIRNKTLSAQACVRISPNGFRRQIAPNENIFL